MAGQFEITEPRHPRDRPMKERMRVVRAARDAEIRLRAQSAAGLRCPIDCEGAQAAAGKVRLQDEGIVPRAEQDDVVVGNTGIAGQGRGQRKEKLRRGSSHEVPQVEDGPQKGIARRSENLLESPNILAAKKRKRRKKNAGIPR